MKKLTLLFFFLTTITLSQVNQNMGAPCKFSVYKSGVEIFHLGSLPPITGDTSYLCAGDSFALQLYAGGANCSCGLIQWTKNGVSIPNATSYTYTVIDTGMYSINLFCSIEGQINLSDIVKVIKCSTSGIEANTNLIFSIFPNPTNEKLFVQRNNFNQETITIYNSIGLPVLTRFLNDKTTEIDISFLNSGVYCVSISNGITTYRKQIIKTSY